MEKWAKLSDLKPGDKVRADSSFTCIRPGAVLEVKGQSTNDGHELYVECDLLEHFLFGSLGIDNDTLIGFEKVQS